MLINYKTLTIHVLDVETELSNILSAEILAEINREVVRTIYRTAEVMLLITQTHNAAINTSATNIFDLDTDSNGRWSVERFKTFMFQVERCKYNRSENKKRVK